MHIQIDGPARDLPHESIEIRGSIRLEDVVRIDQVNSTTLAIQVIPDSLLNDVTQQRYIVMRGEEPDSIVIQFLPPGSEVPFVTFIDDPSLNQPHGSIEILDDLQIGDTVRIDQIDANGLGIRVIPPEEIDGFDGEVYVAVQGLAPHIVMFRPLRSKPDSMPNKWWMFWRKA